MKLKSEIVAFVFMCLACDISSQVQFKGGEISLKRTTGMTHEAKVYLLIDWPASVNKPYVRINWGDGSPMDSLPYFGSNCTLEGASALIYKGNHIFPGSGNYIVLVKDSFFVSNIANIPNSSLQKLNLSQEINTQVFNSPPIAMFAGCLSGGIACNATDFSFSAAMNDSDGDSLGYSIAGHTDIPGYILPAVAISTTGLVTFTSNVNSGLYNVSLKIDEWRKLTNTGPFSKISSMYREIIFKVNNCTGIGNEQSVSALNIYPNPVKDIMHIKGTENGKAQIFIINSMGQVVYASSDISNEEMDLGFLKSGFYSLVIQTSIKCQTKKFVKD